jgi:hypothetical protein
MATYSTNLALTLLTTGEGAGTWGNTTNTNLGTLLEQAISGYVTQAVATGTDTTLTIPNGATGVARNMFIELTGTGGTNTNLIVPANKKLYFIYNNSTGAVTVKVSGQTGVSVPTGKKVVLVSNGTDIVNGLNYIADFGTNSFTVSSLSATSATITTLTSTSANVTTLSSTSANVTTLNSTSANITTVTGTSANITTVSGTTATYTSATISNISSTSANITTLVGTTATYTSATVSNLSSTSANITTLTSSSGTITNLLDGAGSVRSIPSAGSTKTSAYTLAVTDNGEFVTVGSGGSITVPNSTFSAGNVISVYNDTTGNVSINISTTTAYLAGTNTNRTGVTLTTRGIATILFVNGTYCVLSGNVF